MNPLTPLRWMVRLLPRGLRTEYGADILSLFAARMSDEARHSRRAAIRYWFLGAVDLALTVARVRSVRRRRLALPTIGPNMMDSLRLDLSQSVRSVAHRPGFAAMVVLTLALGIGATTTVFSVIDAALLRPLPFPDPDQLVDVSVRSAKGGDADTPTPEMVGLWQAATRQFDGIEVTAVPVSQYTMTGAGGTMLVRRQWVGPSLLDVLDVTPVVGRRWGPIPAGESYGTDVLLSHDFWRMHFNADPSVVGQTIHLLHYTRTIVGVMPPGFRVHPSFPDADLWGQADYRGSRLRFPVVARLKPGVDPRLATAELQAVLDGQQADEKPEDRLLVELTPWRDRVQGSYRFGLGVLLGATGLVLLICCVNVAGLQLVRGSARGREIATRLALGASRGRVMRGLLAESVVLAGLGGIAGVAVAVVGLRIFAAIFGEWYRATDALEVNLRVLALTAGTSVVVGLATGLAPAFKAPAADLTMLVRQGATGAGRRHRLRGGQALIVVQVALALVLLTGAALLINSLVRIVNVDMGFEPAGVLAAEIRAQGQRYQGETDARLFRLHPAVATFYARLETELRSLPGVESVGLISVLPTRIPSAVVVPIDVVGLPPPERPQRVRYQEVNDDLFRTLRIPILRGRAFTARDTEGPPWVAVVSEALARQVFGDADPIGQIVRADLSNGEKHPDLRPDRPREIVGVVGDIRRSLRNDAVPTMYVPYRQHLYVYPAANTWAVHMQKNIVIRSSLPRGRLEAGLQRAVAAVDGSQLAHGVQPLDDLLSASAAREWRWTRLVSLFAAIALFLASLGIYGAVSQAVAGRSREIGIRMALGARPGRLLGMVVRQGMVAVLVGTALGIAASWGLTGFLEASLYDVAPTDPATFAVSSAVLVAVAMLACYVPARHTARISPTAVLRSD